MATAYVLALCRWIALTMRLYRIAVNALVIVLGQVHAHAIVHDRPGIVPNGSAPFKSPAVDVTCRPGPGRYFSCFLT